MAAVALLQFGPAKSSPADIFAVPAPVIGADPPKASELRDGDASVAMQTGALQYGYPITVPPGRNGMAPRLALSYSSQGATYGGIAVGWSLSLPEIREDTSQGRLRTHAPEVEALESDPKADDRFVSSLAGGRPLVEVSEPKASTVYKTYRARNDASFARYERMNAGVAARWRVFTTDGTVMLFGEQSRAAGCNVDDNLAPLTTTIDPFGNEVRYEYTSTVPGECKIQHISWGWNPGAGLVDFASVQFNYSSPTQCATGFDVGSTRDFRTGRLVVNGASRLHTIVASAYQPGVPTAAVHTRTITLGYTGDEACNGTHAPMRFLSSIHESAVGIDSPQVVLPPVRFDYNPATVNLSNVVEEPVRWASLTFPVRRDNLGWGYRYNDDRFPTVEAMLVDIDGDGLLDRVLNASNPEGNGQCKAEWQRNLGPQAGSGGPLSNFAGPVPLMTFPRLKWFNNGTVATANNKEGCSLNGQVTAFTNSVPMPSTSCHDSGTGHPPAPGSDPNNPGPYCFPGGTELPKNTAVPTPYRTYFVYRWLDIDGDGRVDLVAAVHGNINRYDVDQGVGVPPEGTFNWPACPAVDRCKKVDPVCVDAQRSCAAGQPCAIDWTEPGSLTSCLAQATQAGCDALTNTPEFQQGPSGNGAPPNPITRHPYTRCEGLYPWFIYKNQGNGTFATTPTIKYQPVPLESDTGDSSIVATSIASQNHAVMDFDGDGILDAVARPRGSDDSSSYLWNVWLGDGTGGFGPKRYIFPTRSGPHNQISGYGGTWSATATSSEGLLDLNGDGLPDHWLTPDVVGPPNANVAFHDGTQHRLFGQATPPAKGEVETPTSPAVKPGNDAIASNVVFLSSGSQLIVSGTSTTTNRVADVDGDGRVDVVTGVNGTPQVYFNLGGQFRSVSTAPVGDSTGFHLEGYRRRIEAVGAVGVPLTWELRTDLLDLDGNGIPESVSFPDGATMRRAQHDANVPPRLMNRIVNNRGAETTIAYASMHATGAVERTPGVPGPNQWVVKSMTTTEHLPSDVSSTTSYLYKNPRIEPDDDKHWGFRGFEEVTTTAPSGAKSVNRYSYTPDWSGRLTETFVVPSEAPAEVRSVARTTWSEKQLFGGALKTYHATLSEHFTCGNGQSYAACTASPPGYTRTTPTLTSLASTTQPGAPLLWVETSSLLQGGTSTADGDRESVKTFALKADVVGDATSYRLRPLTTTRNHRTGGMMTMFGKSATTWDVDYLVPLTSEVWVDTDDSHRAISRAVYDMATGNVVQRFKPKQNAAGTTSSVFTYDSRKLFAKTVVNELGHQVDSTFEYGTGTKLQTDGPNTRGCTSNCPSGASYPVKEQHKVRVDGLGRPIEQWDTVSDDGNIYTLYLRATTSYVDSISGTIPTSVTQQTKLDTTGGVWKQDKTELDGHGRPIRKITFAQGTAAADHVTSFFYGSDGTLQLVKVPDPTANDASVVSYSYKYDSLGRPTSIARPDAVPDTSGVTIAYDGLTTTSTEVVGAAGGQIAQTITQKDRFGRLIEVHERTDPTTFAITEYTYGPDDAVTSVTDPDGVTVTMTHDFAGRRTQVTRPGGRSWTYTYDLNGNVVAERVPGSTALTIPLFTTTISYDDLDRITSKAIGPRNLSDPDQSLFGNRTETFTWDYGGNHKGFLRYWQSFAPNSATASVTLDVANNNQGQRTVTNHTLNVAGFPERFRQHTNLYYLFGGIRQTRYGDLVGGNNQTTLTTNYDARLMPSSLLLQRTGEPSLTLANQTRNVAGLVTKRRTDTAGAMTFIESNWTYDKLGRVVDQVVQKGPGPTQVARQSMTYFGNDDPATLDHYFGTTQRHFVYGYDKRHQLTSTIETTTPGYFSASYAYGALTGSGRLTRAVEAQTLMVGGSEVKPRDVTYVYGGVDPEQVTQLRVTGSSTPYATYTYDASGNQLTRCLGANTSPCSGELLEYVYDGKDQLRRVTRKVNGAITGSEEYWYQSDGARVAIVKRDPAGLKTELIWFIGDTQAHYDPSGTVTRVFSNVSLGTPVARVERTSNTSTSLDFQFHGSASSLLASVSSTGSTSAAFSYTPFGDPLESTGNDTADHRRRFNDKYQDELSSLKYYGVRFYDPLALGWTQHDPVFTVAPDAASGTPRRASTYMFSLNNPLRYLDPDGRNPGTTLPKQGGGMCMPSESGRGCVMDSGPAAYDGNKAWLSGGNEGISNGVQMSGGEGTLDMEQVFNYKAKASLSVVDLGQTVIKGGLNESPFVTPTEKRRADDYLNGRSTGPTGTEALVVSGALVGAALAWAGGVTLAEGLAFRWAFMRATSTVTEITRETLAAAAAAGGPTTFVVTRLDQLPKAGRALSVAVGQNAHTLANVAREGGQIFSARIPTKLIDMLQHAEKATMSHTMMNGVTGTELRFHPSVSEFVVGFFKSGI